MRIWIYFFCIVLSSLSNATLNKNLPQDTINIKILGINDFHGQISTGRFVGKQAVGGAAVLASYLKQAQTGMEDNTLIAIMGDQVGASTPSSGLLHDEPSILFTNLLGNSHCSPVDRMNPLCNIVATVGNHEFDKGQTAMMDLMYGTDKPPTDFWIPLPYYPGSSYPYISANIVDISTKKPVFPPYIIKMVHGIPVAFIGVVLEHAADSMFPSNAEGIEFLEEARSINRYIPEVKAQGARIIIVLMHEGGNQTPYQGETKPKTKVEGKILDIVSQLDDDIDVVMCGHTHQFLNAYLPNRHGVKILVTQAYSYSTSFAEVTLQVDTKQNTVTNKSAKIITTYADRWPGNKPDQEVQQLVNLAEKKVEPIVNSYVGTLQKTLSRKQNDDGESNLGNFIADALKKEMQAEIGLTNPHGLRDDIRPGIVSWGAIYNVLPFSNHIVKVTLTGQELYDLLEQQWMGSYDNMLQISGINYVYDLTKPLGQRILTIEHNNHPLIKEKTYVIATTDFLAAGGGVFSVMKKSKLLQIGTNDHDTIIHYIQSLKQPFSASIEGRIKRSSRSNEHSD